MAPKRSALTNNSTYNSRQLTKWYNIPTQNIAVVGPHRPRWPKPEEDQLAESSKSVVVNDELMALKDVFVLQIEYESFQDIERHLSRAACRAATSTESDICNDACVRALLKINPGFSSFWEISGFWYQELTMALIAQHPDMARQIQICADRERYAALLAVKW